MATCGGCKIEFNPKRKGQKYHSRECYRASTIRLIKCPQCDKEFQKKFSKQKCCSLKCSFKFRALKNTKGSYVPCSFDGKPVYKMQSRLKGLNFCDNNCKIRYFREHGNEFSRKHSAEQIEKIRQASLHRDYDTVLTEESRKKMADAARNRIWTKEMKNNARLSHLGKVTPEEVKKKIRAHAKYGWKNKMWKGDFASYYAMHSYVTRHKGKAARCVDKSSGNLPCKGRFEWSNIDHEYKRDLDDYIERCTRHHRIYDKQHGLVNPSGKAKNFFAKAGNTQVRNILIDGIVTSDKSSAKLISE